jgi:hypothetical protein
MAMMIDDLAQIPCWRSAFANERKDHRYYELLEDTLHSEFDYRYCVIRDASGEVRAVHCVFYISQMYEFLHRLGQYEPSRQRDGRPGLPSATDIIW